MTTTTTAIATLPPLEDSGLSGLSATLDQADLADLVMLTNAAADFVAYLEHGFPVASVADLELATEELASARRVGTDLDAMRKRVKEPFADAVKRVDGFFQPYIKLTEAAAKLLGDNAIAFKQAEERRAAEAQRLLDQQAAEARARMEAEAEKFAAAGRADLASQARESAQFIVPPAVPSGIPKLAAVSSRKTWKAEVVDKVALIKYIAQHVDERPELADLVDEDETLLCRQASANKGKLSYPGVKVTQVESLARSTGARR